jgi:hypothetical protein
VWYQLRRIGQNNHLRRNHLLLKDVCKFPERFVSLFEYLASSNDLLDEIELPRHSKSALKLAKRLYIP